jgi:hypothetical protein
MRKCKNGFFNHYLFTPSCVYAFQHFGIYAFLRLRISALRHLRIPEVSPFAAEFGQVHENPQAYAQSQ